VSLRIKTATTWEPIETGDINIKWGGDWIQPAKVFVKWGGVWNDSGYVGPPGTPRSLRIRSWNYNQMTVAWDAPADDTGAAPAAYHILRRQAPFEDKIDVDNPNWPVDDRTREYNVAEMTRYRVWVRSRGSGPNPKYSPWLGPLDVKIGRPERPGQTEIKNQIIDTGAFPPEYP
jgi:hypothetical protein